MIFILWHDIEEENLMNKIINLILKETKFWFYELEEFSTRK